jgi:hypothetical protein
LKFSFFFGFFHVRRRPVFQAIPATSSSFGTMASGWLDDRTRAAHFEARMLDALAENTRLKTQLQVFEDDVVRVMETYYQPVSPNIFFPPETLFRSVLPFSNAANSFLLLLLLLLLPPFFFFLSSSSSSFLLLPFFFFFFLASHSTFPSPKNYISSWWG